MEVLDLLIKRHVFPLPPPHRPRPQTQGVGGFSVLYATRISDELLLGFRMATTLILGPLFGIPELDPFCHLGQKCSCVAAGKTLLNLGSTSQTLGSRLQLPCPCAQSHVFSVQLFTGFDTPESQSERLNQAAGDGESRDLGLWYKWVPIPALLLT